VSGVYRTKEEVEEHKQKDPIRVFIEQLQKAGVLSEDELTAMDKSVHEEVEDAAEFADKSPEPGLDQLYADVYAEENEHGRLFFDSKNRVEQ
jgi:pyruvate dehydrogenase E1 component alpha subunit